ncbi:type II secretion system minor pseudopilin GspI [Sphingomonas rubra]|uniref:Type II secretion system protein I n=1 Tax=Sphingomonas rubra TaxID=634430 RepID=A0A1I5SVV6_9SPHN|nr:type II secretion system minor pseudopilin GspI [Sphingomonas rubra]SFP74356.1 general secretion pathway protein I [Sphingomonas rubra]
MRSNGFTLIEVMVAMAVFGLAILALVRLEGAAVRGAGMIDEAMVAQLVARNVALDAMTDGAPPPLGRGDGSEVNGGRTWRWTRQVSATGDPRVVRIDVAVANRAGQVVGRLTMVRPPSTAVTRAFVA